MYLDNFQQSFYYKWACCCVIFIMSIQFFILIKNSDTNIEFAPLFHFNFNEDNRFF